MPTTPTQIPKQTHLKYLEQTLQLAQTSPPKPTNFRVGCVIVSFPPSSPSFLRITSTPDPTPQEGHILSTGYTLELPGNTHAEQCAIAKLERPSPSSSSTLSHAEEQKATKEDEDEESTIVLYTSLEPCSVRLSGNTPCVQRIIALSQVPNTNTDTSTNTTSTHAAPRRKPIKISRVIFGAKEPNTFVTDSQSCKILTEAGVEWEYIPEFEEEILRVAMEGHGQQQHDTKNNDKKEEEKEGDVGKVGREEGEKKETRIHDISEEERRRQEALPRNPKKRMMEYHG